MMKKQRVELGAGMVIGGLGLLLGRIMSENPVSDFFCGTFMAAGIFLFVISLLPDDRYNRLLYRKWFANRNRQI